MKEEKSKVFTKCIPGFSYNSFGAGSNPSRSNNSAPTTIRLKFENSPCRIIIKTRDKEILDHNSYDGLEIQLDLLGDYERLQTIDGFRFIAKVLEESYSTSLDRIFDLMDPNITISEEFL